MRKTKLIFRTITCLFLAGSLFFTGCNPEVKPETPGKTDDKNDLKLEAGLSWLDSSVPSLKDSYKNIFDSIGIACEYSSWNGIKELSVKEVRDGLAKHADSISMGNEFKPDSFFGYQWTSKGKEMVKFTASNGLLYGSILPTNKITFAQRGINSLC